MRKMNAIDFKCSMSRNDCVGALRCVGMTRQALQEHTKQIRRQLKFMNNAIEEELAWHEKHARDRLKELEENERVGAEAATQSPEENDGCCSKDKDSDNGQEQQHE
jgi:hypothetical protein